MEDVDSPLSPGTTTLLPYDVDPGDGSRFRYPSPTVTPGGGGSALGSKRGESDPDHEGGMSWKMEVRLESLV